MAMKRFVRKRSLEDRQLRSLARADQIRADFCRVDGRAALVGVFEVGRHPSTTTSPAADYLFENRGPLRTIRYWRRVTSRWYSRVAGAE